MAQAIWKAVKHQKNQVLVGSANLSVTTDRLFPGLVQRMSRNVFKNRDSVKLNLM